MPSDIDICNMALDQISASNIAAFDGLTKQAVKCALWYPIERDALIQESFWTFADTEVALSPLSITWPSQSYLYTYQYPSDCLKIKSISIPELSPELVVWPDSAPFDDTGWRLSQSGNGVPNQIRVILDGNGNPTGQKAILCDLQNAVMVYIRQITDTALFPPTFIEALALRLARRLAKVFNTDLAIKKDVDSDYMEATTTAKKASANEAIGRDYDQGGYVRARQNGSYFW